MIVSRRRWKLAARVGVFLAGGAVCSVGVAWGLEVWRAHRASKGYHTGEAWTRTLADDISITMYITTVVGRTKWRLHRYASSVVVTAEPPSWVQLPPKQFGAMTGASAYGLPFRCLKYSVVGGWNETDPKSWTTFGGWEQNVGAIAWVRPQQRFFALLPMQPMWPGLAANTLIYAAIFGVVLWGLLMVRRSLRRRSGRCPKCNYDLRGDFSRVCSECGQVFGPTSQPEGLGRS